MMQNDVGFKFVPNAFLTKNCLSKYLVSSWSSWNGRLVGSLIAPESAGHGVYIHYSQLKQAELQCKASAT